MYTLQKRWNEIYFPWIEPNPWVFVKQSDCEDDLHDYLLTIAERCGNLFDFRVIRK